jgi:hypothetical protein
MVREATSPMAKYTDERESDPPAPPIFARNGYPLNIWVSLQTPTRKTFTELIEVPLLLTPVDGAYASNAGVRYRCRRRVRMCV